MREIKFRYRYKQKNKTGRKKIITRIYNLDDIALYAHVHKDEKILSRDEYTGLKSKSGVEIYEGDIVKVSMSYEGGVLPHMGEIVYDLAFGAFATKNESGNTLLHNHCLHTLEVIGNIYENKELLNPDSHHDTEK